jgi:methyl-accepting chemotaxis protein
MQERQLGLQQAVQTAHGIISHFHDLAVKGEMPEVDAKRAAVAIVKSLRYGGSEYFFIQDFQMKMVMHAASPAMDGTDVSGIKDRNGTMLMQEMNRVAQTSGAGFVSYVWPKMGMQEPVEKVSYIQAFKPWGWAIGSGVYVDNVDAVVKTRIFIACAGAAVLASSSMLASLLISRGLLRQLGCEPDVATDIAGRIASGDLTVQMELKKNDRSSLLYAMQTMRDSLLGIVGQVREGARHCDRQRRDCTGKSRPVNAH